VKNGQVKQTQDAYETLTRGILQLPAYLEHLRLGNQDQPVVLLSLLNDLRSAHGQPLLSESTLFSPDMNVYPDAAPTAVADADVRTAAKKLRTVFQTALLGWFRDASAVKHLRKLSFVLSQLETASHNEAARQLWWITHGLVEALLDQGLQATVAVKSLLGQIDRQIKRVVTGGDAVIQQQRPLDLLKNVLFYVAQATSAGARVKELQERFKLRDLLPSAGDLSQTQSDLLGAGAGVMDNVAGAIREDVLSLKDTIDLFVRSKDHPVAELEPVAGKLRTIGDTLGILGLGKLRKAVKDQETVLKEILDGTRPLSDEAVMNVASTLLYVESSLTNLHRGDTEVPAVGEGLVDSALPENEYRALVSHTVGEARAVLGKIKDIIVQFLASPGAFDILEPVPGLANDIKGAMSVMGYARAANLLHLAAQFVSERILATRADIPQQHLDALADAITGVEYFLESVEDDPVGANNSLTLAAIALGQLGMEVPDVPEPAAAPRDHAPPSLAPEHETAVMPVAESIDVPLDFELAPAAEPQAPPPAAPTVAPPPPPPPPPPPRPDPSTRRSGSGRGGARNLPRGSHRGIRKHQRQSGRVEEERRRQRGVAHAAPLVPHGERQRPHRRRDGDRRVRVGGREHAESRHRPHRAAVARGVRRARRSRRVAAENDRGIARQCHRRGRDAAADRSRATYFEG
jgi:chemosensory pili system protein ChpA (sensor histidine kinase/response regulator)